MRSRSLIGVFLLCTTFVLFNALAAAQIPNAGRPNQRLGTDIEVRVSYENDRPISEQVHVQLLTSTGSTLADQFTHDQSQVTFHGVGPGNYILRASGIGIENSEERVTIDARDTTHFAYIRVKPKPNGTEHIMTLGSISSAELNIPDKARKEFEKGVSSMGKNQNDEAEKHFSKAAEIYPQYAAAFNNLGVLAMKSGNAEAGKGFFETAVRADSSNANAYVNLARCMIIQNRIPEAEQLLTKASTLNPNDAESLTLLANAQLITGNLDMAITNAGRVHSLEHQRFALAHLIAARAYEKKDNLDGAAAEYQLFLKESPDNPKADSVRAALQAIQKRVK